ncbi:hypothetical protein [Haemophilus haemolyticus]|jgi:hypothetical protein|uniref:hypothetical protein n=1 Tax=Haemophilus haemolyticus TaxID=726 RepID=UPI000E56DA80|nr:hypothetical protein [Haemophilus haemolyticus]
MDDNQNKKFSSTQSIAAYSTAIAAIAVFVINWLAKEDLKQPLLLLNSAISPLCGSFIYSWLSDRRLTEEQEATINSYKEALKDLDDELKKDFYSPEEKQQLKEKRMKLVLELTDIRKQPAKYVVKSEVENDPV